MHKITGYISREILGYISSHREMLFIPKRCTMISCLPVIFLLCLGVSGMSPDVTSLLKANTPNRCLRMERTTRDGEFGIFFSSLTCTTCEYRLKASCLLEFQGGLRNLSIYTERPGMVSNAPTDDTKGFFFSACNPIQPFPTTYLDTCMVLQSETCHPSPHCPPHPIPPSFFLSFLLASALIVALSIAFSRFDPG